MNIKNTPPMILPSEVFCIYDLTYILCFLFLPWIKTPPEPNESPGGFECISVLRVAMLSCGTVLKAFLYE